MLDAYHSLRNGVCGVVFCAVGLSCVVFAGLRFLCCGQCGECGETTFGDVLTCFDLCIYVRCCSITFGRVLVGSSLSSTSAIDTCPLYCLHHHHFRPLCVHFSNSPSPVLVLLHLFRFYWRPNLAIAREWRMARRPCLKTWGKGGSGGSG